MRKFTLSGLPWLSSKPSKKTLAREIDRLNAALSNRQVTINHLERSCTGKDGQLDSLAGTVTHYQRVLATYDENALAEARRLAVLQIFGGYAHNLNEAAEWLATGQWPSEGGVVGEWLGDKDIIPDMLPAGSDGPEPEVGTTTAYAHGYVKGWNTLLDTIQARQNTDDESKFFEVMLEPLRKTFNRSEAM